MDTRSLYQSKLTTAAEAVAAIPSGSKLSMGMAMTEPPALLAAIAERAAAGGLSDLRVYYCESTPIIGNTILRYELTDRILPYCMFVGPVERARIVHIVDRPAEHRRVPIQKLVHRLLAAHSTAAKGTVSRIVARLEGPVTTPRIDTHYVVTEFGAANLKGLSSEERARALIGLAHPEFRNELSEAARQLHVL
jgi:acyl-CoA hydrolase